jgi:tRNA uracil 4-sulfurtransferase
MIDLHAINAADLVENYLFTETIPAGAVLLDVRDEEEWREWHHEDAVRGDFWELSSDLGSLDPDTTYVLYCGASVQSTQLAEQMQRSGIEAYAFRGGTRALRRLAESSGEG